MKDRRIWIDVTDFLRWRGALTGLQNIQYNIAKQCIADGRNVAFFVYDEPTHTFSKVDFDPDAVAKDGMIGEEVSEVEPSSKPALHRRALSAVKRRTPTRVKELVKKAVGHQPAPVTPEVAKAGVQAPFAKGDIVLVLGGIWHGSFAADMAAAKKKQHFKFVHVVHDMIPVRVPAYVVEDLPSVFGAYKKVVFSIADGLLANSQSSKRDAENFMKENGITVPPIAVFRIADEAKTSKPVPRKGVPKRFILSVGTIEGRKNHMLLYYAYKQGLREGKKLPQLVIAGRIGWLTDDFRYMVEHDPEVKDLIRIHTGVTDSELVWLYQNCLFTIWPSFYEGWGMPVAESIALGKLCLSSDVSSMPEIAPGLTAHFSPYDSKECLDTIVKYLDDDVRKAREQKIKAEYKTTTWTQTYQAMSDFLDSLPN